MAEYLIHACLEREWYVNDFLIPSMVEQGIDRNNIEVWMDSKRLGNLLSCMKCFEECGKRGSGRWHLQDDVVISSDFKEKTEMYDKGQVSGFFRYDWQGLTPQAGVVPAVYMFNSFQCIRIPDDWAGECAEWFFTDAAFRDMYKDMVKENKYDDSFYLDFVTENHSGDMVTNLNPSIVDHIDFLLGGSIVNTHREHRARSDLWEDEEAYNKMKDKLERHFGRSFL